MQLKEAVAGKGAGRRAVERSSPRSEISHDEKGCNLHAYVGPRLPHLLIST